MPKGCHYEKYNSSKKRNLKLGGECQNGRTVPIKAGKSDAVQYLIPAGSRKSRIRSVCLCIMLLFQDCIIGLLELLYLHLVVLID